MGGWGRAEGKCFGGSRKFDLTFIFRILTSKQGALHPTEPGAWIEKQGTKKHRRLDDPPGLLLGLEQPFAATPPVSMHQAR